MVALDVIELILFIALGGIVLFQIIIPAGNGTPLFPSFRKKRTAATKSVAEAKDEVDIAIMNVQAAELLREAAEVRNPKAGEKTDSAKPDAGPEDPSTN